MSVWRAFTYLVQRHLMRRRFLCGRADAFGLVLRFKTVDVMGRHIYKYGVYEEEITRFLLDNLVLEAGDIVLDVGANIGWYSLLLARHRQGIAVHGFEPDPETYALLEGNVRANGLEQVKVWPCALSDSPGCKTLYRYADKNTGRNSLLPINAGGSVEILSRRLDEFVEKEGVDPDRLRFAKIDVEGYEAVVLRGMGPVLSRLPLVLAEFSPRYMRRGGQDPAEVPALFQVAGFTPWRLESGSLRPIPEDELRAQRSNTNIFWVNEARRGHLPLRGNAWRLPADGNAKPRVFA
jgi:FkbM family methyltransferase